MRKFGFIVTLYHTYVLLSHKAPKLKLQGGDYEQLIKSEFTRTLANSMVENETQKEEKGK